MTDIKSDRRREQFHGVTTTTALDDDGVHVLVGLVDREGTTRHLHLLSIKQAERVCDSLSRAIDRARSKEEDEHGNETESGSARQERASRQDR